MLRPRRHPLAFELALVAALALVVRWMDGGSAAPGASGGDGAPVVVAFWMIVGAIASAIWKGLEVAGKITLEVLKWSVMQLWTFAKTTYSALKTVGADLVKGARKAWDFFEDTYEHVLKPAWEKFWKWYDRARAWLDKVIGPVYKFLVKLRSEFLKYYDRWVRPILDTIGIAQKVLRVFQAFGWDWAQRLDDTLTRLQERIDTPFRLLLGKINEVVNQINRVVTANGLFQRVALVRSIERDIRQVQRAFANWRSVPVTEAEYDTIRQRTARTEAAIWQDFVSTVEPGGAARNPQASEIAATWRIAIERRGRF